MKTKDLITIGIFNAVFFVFYMLTLFAFGMVPVTYLFVPVLHAGLGALILLLLAVKVRKKGVFLISAVIQAILFLLMGVPNMFAAFIVGGLLSEGLAALLGGYVRLRAVVGAYVNLMVFNVLGIFAPAYIWADWYVSYAVERGNDPVYMKTLMSLLTLSTGAGVLIFTLAAAIVGTWLARVSWRKHFAKAGLI
jgi:energy-coupling factor transport system substrate-specific component